jgi:hypothetical protein
MLNSTVLVVASLNKVLFRNDNATVKVDLTRVSPLSLIESAAIRGPRALAEEGLIAPSVANKLESLLVKFGFGLHESGAENYLENVRPLHGILRELNGTGRVPRGVLVVTSSEGLWLPENTDEGVCIHSLRMFVSRMTDQTRLGAYGALAAGRPNIAVAGDVAPEEQIAIGLEKLSSLAVPTAAHLGKGNVAITGQVEDLQDVSFARAGRLSVSAVTQTDEWKLDDTTSVYFSMGMSACPHLATADPFQKTSYSGECAGADINVEWAAKKCVIEGIERFVMGDLRDDELHAARVDDLDGEWLNPHSIVAYDQDHRERLNLSTFDPFSIEWWVHGERFDGKPIWIPAALVFSPFPDIPSWLHPGIQTSNAVAAHTDLNQARMRAWLEGVERDAFQYARAAEQPPRRLELSTLPRRVQPLVRYLQERAAVSIVVLNGIENIPVFVALAISPQSCAIGMSAATLSEEGVFKALLEACAAVAYPLPEAPDLEAVNSPHDHASLYVTLQNRRRLDWLFRGPSASWSTIQHAPLVQIPNRVASYTFRCDASDELFVVRVLDPALIPMNFGYDSDPTGVPRFAEGFRQRGITFDEPLFPHPFA